MLTLTINTNSNTKPTPNHKPKPKPTPPPTCYFRYDVRHSTDVTGLEHFFYYTPNNQL